jgi:hypothetical protein
MHAPQCAIQFVNHPFEWQNKRRPPSDQYIVVPGPHSHRRGASQNFPQATAYTISLDGVSNLSRDGETNTHGPVVTPFESLQHERARRCLRAGRGG